MKDGTGRNASIITLEDVGINLVESDLREKEILDMIQNASIDIFNCHKKSVDKFLNPKITKLNKTLNSVNWNTLGMIK